MAITEHPPEVHDEVDDKRSQVVEAARLLDDTVAISLLASSIVFGRTPDETIDALKSWADDYPWARR